jgi:hypothetical protein
MIRASDGIPQNIVIEANSVEQTGMMVDRPSIHSRIEPNRYVIPFVIQSPYAEVIVALLKSQVRE